MRIRLQFTLLEQLLEGLIEDIELNLQIILILNLSEVLFFDCCLVVELHIVFRHQLEPDR